MRREWVEIPTPCIPAGVLNSLSPCGESGLKYRPAPLNSLVYWSLSMRREWVEILISLCRVPCKQSLSMRREWVEIFLLSHAPPPYKVSLHAERVG